MNSHARTSGSTIEAEFPPRIQAEERTASESSAWRHLAFLDGMRGVAAVYVVLHHAMLTVPALGTRFESVFRKLLGMGHGAVDVFIVLSGYCLMLPVIRAGRTPDFGQFILRRSIRIIPTYYVAMILSLALIATLIGEPTDTIWDLSLPVTARDVLLHVGLLQDWSATSAPRINHSFWSIGVEWKLYFLFPALLLLRRRWGPITMSVVATLVGYASWLVIWHWDILNPSAWGSSPYYLGLFALGMAAADVATSGRLPAPRAEAVGFAVLAVAILALGALMTVRGPDGERLAPLQLVSLPIGVITATTLALMHAGRVLWLRRLTSLRVSTYLGQRGYSIYLMHAPIVQICYQYGVARWDVPDAARMPLTLLTSLVATVAIAELMYVLCERRFHQLSRRV